MYLRINKSLVLIISFNIKRRKRDLLGCTKDNAIWNIYRCCGHSFHIEYITPEITSCPICRSRLLAKIEDLGNTANNAFSSSVNVDVAAEKDDDHDSDGEESGEGAKTKRQ